MEAGNVDDVIKNPQHPYTKLLIDSIPWPDIKRRWGETAIVAKESEHAAPADGCRFLSRCPYAMDACSKEPPLFRLQQYQAASCYLHQQNPVIDPDKLSELLPV